VFLQGEICLAFIRVNVAAVAALVLASTLTAGLSQPAGKLSITVSMPPVAALRR
jgi:hypothetical protein